MRKDPHATLRRELLAWYERAQRPLPWRRDRDPYRVWVAEVMLQQTTVKTVVPYYEEFLERFPDARRLAAASEDDVLTAWSGLGYYHRARNLHRGARHLIERHSGRFPKSLEAALAVPGVGLYTGSAVLSIAYEAPLPVVDGNVRRVLARLFCLRGPDWKGDGAFYNLAEELLDRVAPGDWNQAVMELGATICAPRKPACPACPVHSSCLAFSEGVQAELPEGRSRRPQVSVTVAAAVIEQEERLLVVRRRDEKVLSDLWELPQTSLESKGRVDLVTELERLYGLKIVPGRLVARARHTITFRRISAEGYEARLSRRPRPDEERLRWVTPGELEELPVSALTKKLLRELRKKQQQLPL